MVYADYGSRTFYARERERWQRYQAGLTPEKKAARAERQRLWRLANRDTVNAKARAYRARKKEQEK